MITNTRYIFCKLKDTFGDQNWWPKDQKYHLTHNTDPRFEVIVGAILTQNTSWSNVEKTLEKLKKSNVLDINIIANLDIDKIAKYIKSSGFFNQKAKRLQIISKYLKENYQSNLDLLFNRPTSLIRSELLSINGIGPETADSILLYAGEKPVFVVDAYTKRLCSRLPIDVELTYNEIQNFFEKTLKKYYKQEELVKIYNEFHALIVVFAKNYCKKKPKCLDCPLFDLCNYNEKII